jgi:2-dehydropantoate 2-reductase
MEGDMRLIIYGAGGIGCVMGGHLALTGQDVVLIGRPGHVNAINENGLKFITPSGTHMLRIPAVTGPEQIKLGPEDAVCLTMKGQNTEEAMKDLKAVVDDVPVFCFQNGVRNEEIVSHHFPRVYGAMVRVGSVYLEDGEVIARRDPPGWFIIGKYPKGNDETAEKVAEHLRTASFYVRTSEDVTPYKWGKLMGNLGNAIGAITNANFLLRRKFTGYPRSRSVRNGLISTNRYGGVSIPKRKALPGRVLPVSRGQLKRIFLMARSSGWLRVWEGKRRLTRLF